MLASVHLPVRMPKDVHVWPEGAHLVTARVVGDNPNPGSRG